MSLIKYFKANSTLQTNVGPFKYEGPLGQGGNAEVLKFSRDTHPFAIKFLLHKESSKLRRFQDEFFCTAQIPTHKNIVQTYHFDRFQIPTVEGSNGAEYSMIVMKLYDKTLDRLGSIEALPEDERFANGMKLFSDLCEGLHHLHSHGITHRDIKPKNVFFDSDTDAFVLGDLGIARFDPDAFARVASTDSGDRMGNYLFSAPEQADSKTEITFSADIYSLFQVMQWYLTGKTTRGVGRPRFCVGVPNLDWTIFDKLADRALRDAPADRFQSIDDIREFDRQSRMPRRNPWDKVLAFDEVFRRSFPEIRNTLCVTDQTRIREFLENFQQHCQMSDYWYVFADGGDNELKDIRQLSDNRWLLNDVTELSISKLLLYRNSGYVYKNFFILLLNADAPFICSDIEGRPIQRSALNDWHEDYATLFDGKSYIARDEIENGYYRVGSTTFPVDWKRFNDRRRFLVPWGVLVVPTETASAIMTDRLPTENLIKSVVQAQALVQSDLEAYLNKTRNHHSNEITKYN